MEAAIPSTVPRTGRRSTARHALPARYALPALCVALFLAGCGGENGDPDAAPTDAPTDSAGEAADDEHEAEPAGTLADAIIVIDPGHNGANNTAPEVINEQIDAGGLEKNCDSVGAATNDGYAEHEFNFELATELRDLLEDEGAEVILTRQDNDSVGPCLPERAAAANDVDADAAISIHADGGPPTGRGFHIIAPAEVRGYTEPIVEPSRLLGEEIRDHFADATDQPIADYITTEDGIHFRDDLGGLNLSTVPKVFLEAGNMRNEEDAALLRDPQWRSDAAQGLADGFAAFIDAS